MENSDIPEKRRKLDEIQDIPGSRKDIQTRPMTLGELKLNDPRVLVNKLNLNQDVIERLRRVTKALGEERLAEKANTRSSEASKGGGKEDVENEMKILSKDSNKDHKKKEEGEENGIKEVGDRKEASKRTLTSTENRTKDVMSSLLSGNSQGDEDIQEQTASDMQTFRQVLKEVIEQRAKSVEEAVAANSVHLQNRIRDLERENRELQWNARRALGAMKKYVTEIAMKAVPKTSCGIQVEIDKNRGSEDPRNPVILLPPPKPSVAVTTHAVGTASLTSPSSTYVTNTWRSDQLADVTTHGQSYRLQQTTSSLATTTAVVFSVNPRPLRVKVNQERGNAPESERSPLHTNSEQSLRQSLCKALEQSQPLDQTKVSSGVSSQIQSSVQANAPLERISQTQANVLQLGDLLRDHRQHEQRQELAPKPLTSPVQQLQMSSGTTGSLLQQLQLQQQIQQHQHYQQLAAQQKKPPERNNVLPSSQLPLQGPRMQAQSGRPASSDSLNRVLSLQQLRQSHSRQYITSNASSSLATSTASNAGNVPRHSDATFVNSSGQSRSAVMLHSRIDKQVSPRGVNLRSNLQDSNAQVQENVKPSNRSHNTQSPPSVQAKIGEYQSGEILKRQEIVPFTNAVANGSTHKDGFASPTKYKHSQLRQQPNAAAKNAPHSILVPTRKKHKVDDLLPSGYRFSLPSPEYLLQQKPQLQSSNSQASLGSTAQSLKSLSTSERQPLSVPTEPTGGVHTKQPTFRKMQTTQAHPAKIEMTCNQNFRDNAVPQSGYRLIQTSPEKESQQQNAQERKVNIRMQALPARTIQEKQQSLQRQKHFSANEVGNQRSLQSPQRPPIQSPGISSSAPTSEKYMQDSQRTSVAHSATTTLPLSSTAKVASQTNIQNLLPQPSASIAVMSNSIVLSWNMTYDKESIKIDNYELFACQDVTETNGHPIKWKKIGIVKALPLPMACTLTQFSSGSKYFFSVRAVDEKERAGPFSDPCTVSLNS